MSRVTAIRASALTLNTDLKKRRFVGILLICMVLSLFLAFNRIPKLDTVEADLAIATSPQAECFQGFCISQEEDNQLLSRWWTFSTTYLNLIWIGMLFAFVMAGLTEAFIFPSDIRERFSGRGVTGVLQGIIIGPAVNLCSACIVPVAAAFRRRGAPIETTVAITQSSSTMNLPAMIMAVAVFIPIIGGSRIALSVLGALMLGPLVAWVARRSGAEPEEEPTTIGFSPPDGVTWRESLATASLQFVRATFMHALRLGPVMVIAGFASGLVIQWVSPDTVTAWVGDDVVGIVIASSLGVAINVPLMFEIPLVAAMLLSGMGTAPAAALLFTAAAGGPVTFWGLSKVMPKSSVATLGAATWGLGIIGGIVVLGITAVTEEQRTFSFKADYSDTSLASRYSTGGLGTDEIERGLASNVSDVDSIKPVFEDVTESAQIGFRHHFESDYLSQMGGGAVISDFDSDGTDEIYVVNSQGPNALLVQSESLAFEDMAHAAGVDDAEAFGNGGCAADFDNDGFRDLYVSNYGGSKLYRNSGGVSFQDVASRYGLAEADSSLREMGCAWGDYDRDGLVDLIVVRYFHEWKPGIFDTLDFEDALRPVSLYRNVDGSKFEDVTRFLGNPELPEDFQNGMQPGSVWGAGFQPVWADFDDDGDLDLYVANDFGFRVQPNVMWRNDGPGSDGDWKFTDISQDSGADLAMSGMGVGLGDYDVDGDLDMYVTNIGMNVLLRNDGSGIRFSNATLESATGIPNVGVNLRVGWSALFFDYDNDGDEDLYVVSGNIRGITNTVKSEYQPNVLLMNDGDGSFTNVSQASGADHPGSGRGGGYFDMNDDGCLDLFLSNFSLKPVLLRNSCQNGNHWLKLSLVGTESNRDGIGAKIELTTGETRQMRYVIAGSGFLGQSTLDVHFGLGNVAEVSEITITWPSGEVQRLTGVTADQKVRVVEP